MVTLLGKNIKRLAQISGYKQSAIAKKSGLTPKEFSDMLNGRKIIRPEYIMPIAGALGVTPNDLFDTGQPNQAS